MLRLLLAASLISLPAAALDPFEIQVYDGTANAAGEAGLARASASQDQLATVFADLTTAESTRKILGALFPSSTIYMTSERVKVHPEIAQRLADGFVRTLKFIHSHSPEEILAVIPPEISGPDRVTYLRTLREEIPMFAGDGRMPAGAARQEGRGGAPPPPPHKQKKRGKKNNPKHPHAAPRGGGGRHRAAPPPGKDPRQSAPPPP